MPNKKDILKNKKSSDSNGIRTHNHLVRNGTLKHIAKLACLAKWLSVCLQTKWLWVRILLLSLKLQIWCLLWARSSLIQANYRVWIYSETGMWHNDNIQSRIIFHTLCLTIRIDRLKKPWMSKSLKLIIVYWNGKFISAISNLYPRKTGIWRKKSLWCNLQKCLNSAVRTKQE